MNFVEELTWRGMIHDITPGTEEQLNKEMTAAYVGIDPTAESLHIGHLVSVMMLKHFQLAGHKPIALVGGATGMIGDPSGKSEERNLLDEKLIKRYLRLGQPDTAAIRAGHANIRYHLDYIAWLVDQHRWLAGEALSLADITAAAQLSTVDYLGDVPWDDCPAAKNWYARIKSRPSLRPILADSIPGIPPARAEKAIATSGAVQAAIPIVTQTIDRIRSRNSFR